MQADHLSRAAKAWTIAIAMPSTTTHPMRVFYSEKLKADRPDIIEDLIEQFSKLGRTRRGFEILKANKTLSKVNIEQSKSIELAKEQLRGEKKKNDALEKELAMLRSAMAASKAQPATSAA